MNLRDKKVKAEIQIQKESMNMDSDENHQNSQINHKNVK